MENNDIYSIVERLAILEGRITPTNVKHGLNKQQKSVPQMPALFRPKTQKILGGNSSAKNPMSGYAFGGCEEDVKINIQPEEDRTTIVGEGDVAEDVLDKVKRSLTDYLKNLEDEIKSDSDLKDKKKEDGDIKVKDTTDRDLVAKDDMDEGWRSALGGAALAGAMAMGGAGAAQAQSSGPNIVNPTTVIQQIQSGKIQNQNDLMSALGNASNKQGVWKQLQNTAGMQGSSDINGIIGAISHRNTAGSQQQPVKSVNQSRSFVQNPSDNFEESKLAPVNTITNECGLWEMHGDEHTGFEIRRAGRCLPTRFKNLDEAEMAIEMFAQRQRKHNEAQDYIDEA